MVFDKPLFEVLFEFRGTCEPALIVGIGDENVGYGDEYDDNFLIFVLKIIKIHQF